MKYTCSSLCFIRRNYQDSHPNSWRGKNSKFDLCQSLAQNCPKIWFFEIWKKKRIISDGQKSWKKSISCCSFIFFLISNWPKEHVIESLKSFETKLKSTKILEQPIGSLIYVNHRRKIVQKSDFLKYVKTKDLSLMTTKVEKSPYLVVVLYFSWYLHDPRNMLSKVWNELKQKWNRQKFWNNQFEVWFMKVFLRDSE